MNNVTIKLGQNANENQQLWYSANPKHIWIHLSSFPSSHVIIEDENPDKQLIDFAAKLCKMNSKYKNLKNIKYTVTNCGNLKRGDNLGEVEFKSNRKVKDYPIY